MRENARRMITGSSVCAAALLLAVLTVGRAGGDERVSGGGQSAGADRPQSIAQSITQSITLHGTVVDAAGEPVAGARVWIPIQPLGPPGAPSAVTAADGSFAIHGLPPNEAFAVVCADGFLQGEEIIPYPAEPVRIVLDKAAALRGRVLGPDGTPQPDAQVRARPASWNGGVSVVRFAYYCLPVDSVVADAEGSFAFERLEPGPFTVVAEVPGLHPGSSSPVLLEAGSTKNLDLQLREGGVVAGRVIDPDGAPIPGARVEVWLSPGEIKATSGPDGSFRLAGADRGYFQVRASAEHFQPGAVEVYLADEELKTDVVLEREGNLFEIAGRVLGPDGLPVEGALVAGSAAEAASARDGSFSLRLPEARFAGTPLTVFLSARKEGLAPFRKDVVLSEARTEGLVIHLETGVRVSGRILGLTPAERKGVEATLSGLAEGGNRPIEITASSDAAGRFELGPVPPGSWLAAARSGHRRASRQIVLDPGQAEVSVDLTFPPLWEVSGRVFDAGGLPAARASVAASDGKGLVASAWTHSDGTFSLRVPAGDLTLIVRHGHLDRLQPLVVGAAPVSGVEVRLGAAEP
jgi:hypothetical protein